MGGAALAIGRMTDCFFYGTLCHAPLLTGVLGRAVAVEPALLPSHSVFWAAGGAFPVIVAGGDGARGVLARDLTDADLARLDFYEDGYDARVRMVRVEGQGAACAARGMSQGRTVAIRG